METLNNLQDIDYDVVIIGGGPAGIACGIETQKKKLKTLIIEREANLGGILKQCIHDGFGLQRYNKLLTGPEYAYNETQKLINVDILVLAFVTKIYKEKELYTIDVVTRSGIKIIKTKNIVFSTGCRERTSRQIGIYGTNPSGVFTAGTCQYYINRLGKMPIKKCVILGSGDIGLIMARRITLEGGVVLGVYEIKNSPSGLSRNIEQCLNDYNIPLYLNHTVSRVFGVDRLEAVEIVKVDDNFKPIPNTEQIIKCDSLILSVGLIPENDIATSIGVKINKYSKGPMVDQNFMTNVDNIYACGNCSFVFDLVDYVSESGEIVGKNISLNQSERKLIDIEKSNNLMCIVPNLLDVNDLNKKITFFFRSSNEINGAILEVYNNENLIYEKKYIKLLPPEMEKVVIEITDEIKNLKFILKEQ